MFDSIGWGEIVVLALGALFIFGPERLPDLAKEAAAGLKRVRTAITGVREQVNESFGDDLPDLRDLDLRKYHPRTFLRNQLLDDDDTPTVHRGSGSAGGTSSAGAPVVRAATGAPPALRHRRDVGRPVTPSGPRRGPRRCDAAAQRAGGAHLAAASSGGRQITCRAASDSAACLSRSRVSVIPCWLRSWNLAQRTTASVTPLAREDRRSR